MDTRLLNPFIYSTKDIIKQMTDIDIETYGESFEESGDISSFGVTSVINFSGKIKGRFILDMAPSLASEVSRCLTGEASLGMKDRMFAAAISEMNNIISGDANTFLNNNFSLGLRLAPPIVFTGKNIVIATSKMNSTTVRFNTPYGDLKINIGFQGGVD